ncbi:MAG: protein kinase, partial [Burkholderiaceae bacterium]
MRVEYLSRLRVDDGDLADELERLLCHQAAAEDAGFLAGNALGDSSLAGTSIAETVVGSYSLERPLGAGGMGTVWLARRSDGRFEGKVAVKLLNLALLARGGPQRFEREGSVLARLAHPNIARLLDAGITPDGQPYLVIEYVEGVPIDRYCDDHALDVHARIDLFLCVLDAVAHAHSKLILHRDLKPLNVLVSADGQVKLLDFGIAKLLDEETQLAHSTALTEAEGRAFTPDYAAPEQIQGADVTTATDVYSLGVLLYELLGGRHPTHGATTSRLDRLRAIIEKEPARLSDVARTATPVDASHRGVTVQRLTRTLRGDLDNIVAKALKKAPAERYASAAALAAELRRYLHDEPVEARPDSVNYRVGKFVRRYRLAVGAASATLLALTAGVIGTTWQAIEARHERDQARFHEERALAKSHLMELMLSAMGDADRPLTQREILDRSVILVEKQLTGDPRIAITMLLPIAGQYHTLGDAERELAVLQRAGEIASVSGDPGLIADVACGTVETQMRRGQMALAEEQLSVGLKALDQITRPNVLATSACLQADAEIAIGRGDLDRALTSVMDAIVRVEGAGKTLVNVYPKLLSFLGALHLRRGELQASYEVSKRLQRLDEEAGRTETVDFLLGRRNDAVLLVAMGEYRSARAILESLASRWRAVTGDEAAPPWLGLARGRLMLTFGELDEAQGLLEETVRRYRSQGNADRAAIAEFALAQIYLQQGRFDGAERLLASVESQRPASPGRYTLNTPATVRATLRLA